MLLPGEQIIFITSQSRFAPGGSLSPNSIHITNMRVLFKNPRWLGLRAEILDISYKDISTIKLKRGVFTTELFFKTYFSNYKIKLPALEKRAAQRVSQLIQRGIRRELPGQNQVILVPEMVVSEKETAATTTAAAASHRIEVEEGNRAVVPPIPLPSSPTINIASCRYCNHVLRQPCNVCPECGKDTKIETNILKVCPGCDAVTSDDAVFCSECHQKFPDSFLQ